MRRRPPAGAMGYVTPQTVADMERLGYPTGGEWLPPGVKVHAPNEEEAEGSVLLCMGVGESLFGFDGQLEHEYLQEAHQRWAAEKAARGAQGTQAAQTQEWAVAV